MTTSRNRTKGPDSVQNPTIQYGVIQYNEKVYSLPQTVDMQLSKSSQLQYNEKKCSVDEAIEILIKYFFPTNTDSTEEPRDRIVTLIRELVR